MTTERELEQELAKLKEEAPDPAERWVRALVTSLDGSQTGVQNSKGVLRVYEDAETYELPEEWLHVASGPGGISEEFARTWDLYVDPAIHDVPSGVKIANLPIEILLGTNSAFV